MKRLLPFLFLVLVATFAAGLAYEDYSDRKEQKAVDQEIERQRVSCEAQHGALVWIVHAKGEDAQLECVQYRTMPLTLAQK